MLEQEQSVRSPPSEEKGAAETMCDELTVTPIPCQEMGVKLSPGRRQGWGEGVSRSGFVSHYPALI